MALRITWTTQVWTTASGKTEVIASGRPVRPSQQAIRTSRRPRLRSWVSTECQNFAPSDSAIQPATWTWSSLPVTVSQHVGMTLKGQPTVVFLYVKKPVLTAEGSKVIWRTLELTIEHTLPAA